MTVTNDGKALEAAIAGFFAEQGYEVQLNATLEGRSGGRHEVDVLATKTDPVATIRIAVECKDWMHPIEKEVVSKLHYLLGDLGINKGIVVSTAGWRQGAEHAARELAIDLWGPAELRQYLGSAAVARLVGGTRPMRSGLGWPNETPGELARKRAHAAARGSAVLRRQEEVVAVESLWVPGNLATMTVAQPSQKWGREKITSRVVSNLYDGLAGRFVPGFNEPPQEIELGDVVRLQPLVKPAKVAGPIVKAYERAKAVTSKSAIDRHAAALSALGIPLPIRGVTIDAVQPVYVPCWVAVLRLRETERLVAVSGRTGEVVDVLSEILTANISQVRQALGR